MRLSVIILLFLLCPLVSLRAQSSNDHQLLWAIDGPGLAGTSYLYGLVYLEDERVFQFSNELWDKFLETEVVVTEIDLETFINWNNGIGFDESETPLLKDLMTPEEIFQLDSLFQEAGHPEWKELGEIPPSSIRDWISLWHQPAYTEKREIQLSDFFSKVARDRRLPIKPLERISTFNTDALADLRAILAGQVAVPKRDSGAVQDSLYERRIAAFLSGNLERIRDVMPAEGLNNAFSNYRVKERGQRYLPNLLNIMRDQRAFITIGVGMMAAEGGMLELLRGAGLNVRPVTVTFSEQPAEPPAGTLPIAVPNCHTDSLAGYSVCTPAFSFKKDIELQEEDFIKSSLSVFDYLNQTDYYCLRLEDTPISGKPMARALVKALALEGGWKVGPLSRIGKRRYACEATTSEGGLYRMQLIEEQQQFFLLAAGNDFRVVPETATDGFFESFRLFEPRAAEPWLLTVPELGFEQLLPGRPTYEYRSEVYPEDTLRNFRSHLYSWSGPEDNAQFFVVVRDYPTGITIYDADELLDEQAMQLRALAGGETVDADTLSIDGYPGRQLGLIKDGICYLWRFLIRNSRTYTIFGITSVETDTAAFNSYLNTFRLLPLPDAYYPVQRLREQNLTLQAPVALRVNPAEITAEEYPLLEMVTYEMEDTTCARDLFLQVKTYSPYYALEQEALVSELRVNVEELLESPQLVFAKDTSWYGYPALWLRMKAVAGPGVIDRFVFFYGPRMYYLWFETGLNEALWATILRSMRPLRTFPEDFWQQDRLDQLVLDLGSNDATLRRRAMQSIDNAMLEPAQLSLIYKQLQRSDLPQDTLKGLTLRHRLIRELRYNQDERTLPFIEELFQSAPPEEQEALLLVLSNIKTPESYAQCFRLVSALKQDSTGHANLDDLALSLKDSLALLAPFTDQLLSLQDEEGTTDLAYELLYHLVLKDTLGDILDAIRPYRAYYLSQAKSILKEAKANAAQDTLLVLDSERLPRLYRLCTLLGELPAKPEVDTFLRQLLELEFPYLMPPAMDALLMHDEAVDSVHFASLNRYPFHWGKLLQLLEYEGRLNAIPDGLYSPKTMVEAYAFLHFGDNLAPVTGFDWFDELPFLSEGTSYTLYYFLFELEGYDGTYLGIGGVPNDALPSGTPFFFDYSETPYDGYNSDALINEILQRW